jgi:hypothetical protein
MNNAFAIDEPNLTVCHKGYSFFFDLIAKNWHGNNSAPLHRICTLMRKMGVACFTSEVLGSNAEIESEKKAVVTRTGGNVEIQAVRLSFFKTLPPGGGNWRDIPETDFLGYTVVATLTLPTEPIAEKRSYILESVVLAPGMLSKLQNSIGPSNYYVHCSREFETKIGVAGSFKTYKVEGAFFCQQNDLTHICAHAVLRMVLNTAQIYNGPKITSEKINSALGIDHTPTANNFPKKRVGKFGPEKKSTGLSNQEILTFINSIGMDAHFADFVSNPAMDYDAFIYPLIESGCPTILGIYRPDTAHVVAALGHTLNTDRWTPEARHGYGALPFSPYISTCSWVDHFIVSDDNFGMYSTLPTDAIRNVTVPKYNPNLHAGLAIGIVPKGVTVTGYDVEQYAASLARKLILGITPTPENAWFNWLKNHAFVCRTLLSYKDKYLKFVSETSDEKDKKLSATEIKSLESVLPDLFWVTEITVPNLYAGNKRKLGDVISDAKITRAQFTSGEMVKFTWLPGMAWSNPTQAQSAPIGWAFFGHIPLIRGCEPNKNLSEW